MVGQTHIEGGVLFGIGASALLVPFIPETSAISPVLASGLIISVSGISALINDIDAPNSKGSRTFPFLAIPYRISAWIVKKNAKRKLKSKSKEKRAEAREALEVVDHRGITHFLTTWALILLPILLFCDFPSYLGFALLGVVLGGLSHIFLDSLNPSGTAWLAPFTFKRFHLLPKKLRIPTSKQVRTLISIPLPRLPFLPRRLRLRFATGKEGIFAIALFILDIYLLYLLFKFIV